MYLILICLHTIVEAKLNVFSSEIINLLFEKGKRILQILTQNYTRIIGKPNNYSSYYVLKLIQWFIQMKLQLKHQCLFNPSQRL